MTDKEKKSKIADILMDFQEEYSNEVINRPMLASLYAGNILSFIDSLQEEPTTSVRHNITEDKLLNLRKLADAMYYAAQHLTTDASRLHKAMEEYHQFIINEYHKEEPVSNDFKMALAEMIDKAQTSVVEPWVIAAQWKDELIKLAKSEEPVSEDLEQAAFDYAEACKYEGGEKLLCVEHFKAGAKWQQEKEYTCYEEAFEDGAKWKKEQFEKNRLAACDRQTEKEAEIERDFVMSIMEKEHRQPTFDDAIKYGMRLKEGQMMASSTDVTVHIEAGNYPYIPQIELYDYDKDIPLAKEGDKYKVILIKEN